MLEERGTDTMLNAALSYARLGWAVIPLHTPIKGVCDCPKRVRCESPGKHPRTQHGLTDATDEEFQIRRWWRQWPEANIGLPIRPGFVAVDVDGDEGMQALQASNYQLPPTAIQATGRGYHYLYRTATPIGPKSAIMPKVDLRGPGSYIVAEPSIHASGTFYQWEFPLDQVQEAPPWIAKVATAPKHGAEESGPVDMSAILAGVPEGRRDVEIFRAACKLRAADIPMDFALHLVKTAANACVPPFDSESAEQKVYNAYRQYPAGTKVKDLPVSATLLGRDSVMVEFDAARFVFSDLEKSGRELATEMEVQSLLPGTPQDPYVQRLNLLSMSTRDSCRRELEHLFGKTHNWGALLAKAAYQAQDAFLKVDRSIRASDIVPPEKLTYVIDDIVPDNGTTIFFGAGSGTKTFLMLDMAFCISRGLPWLGRPTAKKKVLHIDYETGEPTFGLRLRRLAEGHGLALANADLVRYWWADGIPFHDQVESIRRCCDENQIEVITLDHLAIACGSDAREQEAATRFYRSVGKIGRMVIALAHITGEGEKDPAAAYRPFGSIFWSNGARRTFYVLRQQEQGAEIADLGIYCRKVNDGKKPADFGATVTFDDPAGPITVKSNTMDLSGLLKRARGPEHVVYDALTRTMTEKELAAVCNKSERWVKDILNDHPRLFEKVHQGGGAGNQNLWKRVPRRDDDAFTSF